MTQPPDPFRRRHGPILSRSACTSSTLHVSINASQSPISLVLVQRIMGHLLPPSDINTVDQGEYHNQRFDDSDYFINGSSQPVSQNVTNEANSQSPLHSDISQVPGNAMSGYFGRAPSAPSASRVNVNGVQLGQSEIQILQAAIGPVYPGSYWYDPRCGAFGLVGGPCQGVLPAGPALGGGRLARNASGNTGTGVFINGREIHSLDVSALQGMGVIVLPGNWWVNADGTYGMEGSPFPLGNLRLHALATKNSSGGQHTWRTNMGHYGGSDGQGFIYIGGPGWTWHN